MIQAPPPQSRDRCHQLGSGKREFSAPISLTTPCFCTRAGHPRLHPWKRNSSFLVEKSPGKPFSPSQLHKGKPSEPAPHHPRGSTDAALGASTGVLEANLQIRELGQAKTFPLTAPGTGICQGLSRIHAQREMPWLVRGRGQGLGGGECRALPEAAAASAEVSEVGKAGNSSRGRE